MYNADRQTFLPEIYARIDGATASSPDTPD